MNCPVFPQRNPYWCPTDRPDPLSRRSTVEFPKGETLRWKKRDMIKVKRRPFTVTECNWVELRENGTERGESEIQLRRSGLWFLLASVAAR